MSASALCSKGLERVLMVEFSWNPSSIEKSSLMTTGCIHSSVFLRGLAECRPTVPSLGVVPDMFLQHRDKPQIQIVPDLTKAHVQNMKVFSAAVTDKNSRRKRRRAKYAQSHVTTPIPSLLKSLDG